MSDIHALIHRFLQQHSVTLLAKESEEGYTKSGVVPFLRNEDGVLRYYVMKPRGDKPGLGAPLYQLCKGTRMYHVPGVGWRDIKDYHEGIANKETLIETALREGVEELGLKFENIARLFALGGFDFASATTGKGKKMWLFAAEMEDEDDFLPERDIAVTTAARAWLSASEFAAAGRDDHAVILNEIDENLRQYFNRHSPNSRSEF